MVKRLKFFFVVAVFSSLSLSYAMAQSDTVLAVLAQIRKGLAAGQFEALPDSQKVAFEGALVDARNILNGASSSSGQFMCVSTGNNYYVVTNIDTNKKYGTPLYGLDTCKSTLPQLGSPFSCMSSGNNYFVVTNLNSGVTLGVPTYGLDSCKQLLPLPGQKLACISTGNNYYTIMNLQTGDKIGVPVYGLDSCKAQLP